MSVRFDSYLCVFSVKILANDMLEAKKLLLKLLDFRWLSFSFVILSAYGVFLINVSLGATSFSRRTVSTILLFRVLAWISELILAIYSGRIDMFAKTQLQVLPSRTCGDDKLGHWSKQLMTCWSFIRFLKIDDHVVRLDVELLGLFEDLSKCEKLIGRRLSMHECLHKIILIVLTFTLLSLFENKHTYE